MSELSSLRLNPAQLKQTLQTAPKHLGLMPRFWSVRPRFSLHLLEQATSTNTVLWELAQTGAPAGTVVIAKTQAAGRGQWGRQWQSLEGGLYLSLLLQPDLPVHQSHSVTLASAWGIATSLRNLGIGVQLKWPNDLVLQGKKLGGVLSETRIEGDLIRDLVVGVGLNWSNPVPPTGIALQSVNQSIDQPGLTSLETLAAIVLYGLMQGYFYWQAEGEVALQQAYQTIMANLGQVIPLDRQPVRVVGISPQGNLRVQPLQQTHLPGPKTLEVQPGTVTLGYNA